QDAELYPAIGDRADRNACAGDERLRSQSDLERGNAVHAESADADPLHRAMELRDSALFRIEAACHGDVYRQRIPPAAAAAQSESGGAGFESQPADAAQQPPSVFLHR